MPTSLFQYEMLPTTWFYVSGLMLLAVFFRFNRFWSVRNFDIIGLILFSPGLLYIAMAGGKVSSPLNDKGYLILTIIGIIVFIRLIFDAFMVRRPLLEPNLSSSALTFACIMLLGFMIANVFLNNGDNMESPRTLRLEQILSMRKTYGTEPIATTGQIPGYVPFQKMSELTNSYYIPSKDFWNKYMLSENTPAISVDGSPAREEDLSPPQQSRKFIPNSSTGDLSASGKKGTFERSFIALILLAVQAGTALSLVYIGHGHFGNVRTGVAAAFFYLLLPYVAQISGDLTHIVPGFLIILAIALYRRPICSGLLIGLAGSLVFYPLFLIPLWASFYYKRGLARFLLAAFSAVLAMLLLLLLSPSNLGSFGEQVALMFGYRSFRLPCPDGLWSFCPTIYRFPIVVCFGVICFGLILWPTRKNLATLISCTALLMLGVQFWIGNSGGLYMAWFMPALILTIFRPNLEDRIATSTVVELYH